MADFVPPLLDSTVDGLTDNKARRSRPYSLGALSVLLLKSRSCCIRKSEINHIDQVFISAPSSKDYTSITEASSPAC